MEIPHGQARSVITQLATHKLPTADSDLRVTKVRVKVMLRRKITRSFCVGVRHPSGAQDQKFVTVRLLLVSWCGASSLTRGRVCRLQLLLDFASAAILGAESRGNHDHILLSQIRRLQPGRPDLCIYVSQWQGGPVIPPRHWVPFSSLSTTRRAAVKVFESSCTRGSTTDKLPVLAIRRRRPHRKRRIQNFLY
jgi:hypothetical protein